MDEEIKIITEHWGQIDPLKIEDYISIGGYKALEKARKMKPEDIILEIKNSGLRGRGGAGFPTGEKWGVVSKETSTKKYFICNLDESEPGTYKDRLIVDNNPHSLIEGIIIASLAIGAHRSFVYTNGNYEKQREILEKAIEQAQSKNFLGELEIEIFSGAGAYVCGEETALINSIEGNRGEPKMRPPYPVTKGLFGCPTAVNNAETIANIPWIISNGSERYKKIGSTCSPGTKLYILSGAVKNPGLYELPTGQKIKDIIEIGGGVMAGKDFWFTQVGGSCGGLFTKKDLEEEMNYGESCACQVGAGSILVVDKSADIFDLLMSWAGFYRRESCGKCVPCREGTFRLNEIIKRLSDGEISDRDKEALDDILWTLGNTTFCPFGKFATKAIKDAVEKLNVISKK